MRGHTYAHVVVTPLHQQNMYTTLTYTTSIVAMITCFSNVIRYNTAALPC